MVFGGYILRLTHELAEVCATRFAQTDSVSFISLDSAAFEQPVPVGATLDSEAMVVYMTDGKVQIRVKTSVRHTHSGRRIQTGVFTYSFKVETGRRVQPMTYEEYMEWITAKRYVAHLR
jgi:acyl-coenzyme A thioesterase 9